MKHLNSIFRPIALLLALVASSGLARADEPIVGHYLEARNTRVWLGPSHEKGVAREAGPHHHRGDFVVLGWKVERGEWEKQDLAGLGVAVALRVDGSLDDLKRSQLRSVLYVDEKATEAQHQALISMAHTLGKKYLGKVIDVRRAPIRLEKVSLHDGLSHSHSHAEESLPASNSLAASPEAPARPELLDEATIKRLENVLGQQVTGLLSGDTIPTSEEDHIPYEEVVLFEIRDAYQMVAVEYHEHARCACAANTGSEVKALVPLAGSTHALPLKNHFKTKSFQLNSLSPAHTHTLSGKFQL